MTLIKTMNNIAENTQKICIYIMMLRKCCMFFTNELHWQKQLYALKKCAIVNLTNSHKTPLTVKEYENFERKKIFMKYRIKQKQGITLIALVVTVIVLISLAGVSISMLTGQNRTFK